MDAYKGLADKPWLETVGPCTLATAGDVLLTFLAYALGAAAWRDWRWAWPGSGKVSAALAGLGFAIASLVEFVALSRSEWAYNDRMPIVPGVELGLLPLLQLTLFIPLAFWIGNKARRVALED